jgi:group I intron endonuclease
VLEARQRKEMDKKGKIREYKNTPRPMGVYQIRNKVNGKVFIGSSNNLPAILNRYRAELNFGNCRNLVLQQDWNQFGPDAFEFKELEILTPMEDPKYNPAEDLKFLEDMWIEKLKPFDENGYNKPPRNGST